ncbi:MAG: ribonuclease P protein component [Chloroflexi bacterium]|nr:ribonuclease P protein component [Chloroflexota bacterium]
MVQHKGRWWSNPLLLLRALPNDREATRFGFLVSKRVGNAVTRNRVRRRLREILRREPVAAGWDLVFIARSKIAEAPFAEIERSTKELLGRGQVYHPPPQAAQPRGDSR